MEELLELRGEVPAYGLSASRRALVESCRWNGSGFEDILIPEEDRKVYVRELTERTEKIFKLGRGIADSFIEIGRQLKAVSEKSLYKYACIKAQEFTDIYDFAFKIFGFCKTTTVNLIGIVEEFGEDGGPGLKEEWRGYAYSQLVELLPFVSYERRMFTPEVTVAEIREIRKGEKKYPPEMRKASDFGITITWQSELKRIRAAETKALETELKEKAQKEAEQLRGLLSLLSEAGEKQQAAEAEIVESIVAEAPPEPQEDERYIVRGNIMRGKLGLKNKHDREAWLLHLFDSHPDPYLDIPELRIKIWRYDFENGAMLIIAGEKSYGYFDILEPSDPDRQWFMTKYTRAQVVDWLTSHAKEI